MNSSVGIHTKVQIRFLCINIFTLVPSSKNVPNQKDQLEDRSKVKISSEINALFFYRSQNFLCQSKFFEPVQKFDCIWCLFKHFCVGTKTILLNKIIFFSGTKCLCLPQYVNKLLVWHEKFGPAQNILGPVKEQGISHL